MNYVATAYALSYDALDQQIHFDGVLRPKNEGESAKSLSI
jgi:hypothetical protein